VIVTTSYPAAAAAKQGTQSIPVVAVGTGDPVGTHLVDSLARPGGAISANQPMAMKPQAAPVYSG
jgi:putative ABC transport system substrate-binding protein